jgi:hypothetical protein
MTSLEQWLDRSFGIIGKNGLEVQFPCPKCSHPSFFFNLSKKVGYCHRASCNYKPNIKLLNRHTRTQFGDFSTDEADFPEQPSNLPVEIPESELVVDMYNGGYVTRFPNVVAGLQARNLPPVIQYRYGLRYDGTYIYVPVYFEGKLVNYVGRRAFHLDQDALERAGIKKYQYCTGAKTQHYLFDWDRVKLQDKVTFTENTFNAMWLGDVLWGSTNFGSTLSDTQIELIRFSKIQSVVLLWDEGAESRASKAVTKLSRLGIAACSVWMKGQPDTHSLETLTHWVQTAHEYAMLGKPCLRTY